MDVSTFIPSRSGYVLVWLVTIEMGVKYDSEKNKYTVKKWYKNGETYSHVCRSHDLQKWELLNKS